jgi:hypothetical protein
VTIADELDVGIETLDPIAKLAKEVKSAGALLDREQARFLVDLYYRFQEHRIALNNQSRSLAAAEKPDDVVQHFAVQMGALERQMVGVLDRWTEASEVGRWSRGIVGIGPIIAAGFLAHIDIARARSVGNIWRFAGLDPTVTWEKGQRRPWNASLKLLCWKTGDSFVKVSGRPNAYYGQVYRERKELEVARNLAGYFAETAAETLAKKNIRDRATRETYEAGRLPDGRIDLRARRYAVKRFLSHWHEVAHWEHFGYAPPNPWVIEHGGHVHKIPVPDWEPPVQGERPRGLPDAAPHGTCNRCGRKSWADGEWATEDRMLMPDGNPCGGWIAPPR